MSGCTDTKQVERSISEGPTCNGWPHSLTEGPDSTGRVDFAAPETLFDPETWLKQENTDMKHWNLQG